MIDRLFEHGGIEFLLTHQVDQNARIKIATPRAHDHSAGWGQSYTGVDRFAGFDRGHACAIAEMDDHEAVRQTTPELAHNRFAREAVKSVALNSLRLRFPGNWQQPAQLPAMRRERWCRSRPPAATPENALAKSGLPTEPMEYAVARRWLNRGFLAEIRQKQKGSGQPFLARIEQLIDQVLFNSTVPTQ